MTTNRDIDRITRAWLEAMPSEAPDRVVASVTKAVATMPQDRSWGRLPASTLRGLGFAVAGAAAAVLVLFVLSTLRGPNPHVGTPTDAPTPSSTRTPVAEALAGSWLADVPADMSFPDSSEPATISLTFEANGRGSIVTLSNDAKNRMTMWTDAGGADEISFTPRTASEPITVGGTQLPGCAIGDIGRYSTARSSDGLRLTLSVIEDGCASRAAVFARTWVRTLGDASTGGLGVVDAFDPLFTVELPAGSYTVERPLDAMVISQPIPEFQFLAFKDPQGFLDPCDVAAGRYDIAQGADAFVAYFRQLAGFTVDATTELTVDGHRAVRLEVHANQDASCPSGFLIEWQPKAMTDDRSWVLRPGDNDVLYLVELDGSTLMFEVLPPPHPLESEVIGSIRFLDALPTEP